VAILVWIRSLRAAQESHGLTPIFYYLFAFLDYTGTFAALIVLVGAWFVARSRAMTRVPRWVGQHPTAFAVANAAVLALAAQVVYRAHPLSMDEYTVLFQSEVFAAGKLAGQFPPSLLDWLVPRAHTWFFASSPEGQVATLYWPSFSLILTPFTWLGIPWACNPVLSGITLVVIHRLALRVFGNADSAGAAVLLTAASPVFLADGISYYSMTAHMLANAVFALLLLEPTTKRLLAAGLVGSIALTLHNPFHHFLFALPWLVWLAFRPGAVRNLAFLAAGYLPLTLLLGLGWFWFQSGLMGDGANAGPYGPSQIGSAFAWPTAQLLFARLVGLAKVWLWAVPGMMLLAAYGFWKWRHDHRVALLGASAVATLVGFLATWVEQGHGWGFRYFHSAWFALPLLAVAAFTPLSSTKDEQQSATALRSFMVACTLLTLVISVPLRALQIRDFMDDHLAQLPHYSGSEPRVVFVDTEASLYGLDLLQNDPFLRSRVLRLPSYGAEVNAAVMKDLQPSFRRVYSDRYGEVWSAAEPAQGRAADQ